MQNGDTVSYRFSKYGILIPWEARLNQDRAGFTPGERVFLHGIISQEDFDPYPKLVPIHKDERYQDQFFFSGKVLQSLEAEAIIRILRLLYSNILVGYRNDYLVEILDLQGNVIEGGNSESDLRIKPNRHLAELIALADSSLLNIDQLLLRRYIEEIGSLHPNQSVEILQSFLLCFLQQPRSKIAQMRQILLSVCKSLYFLSYEHDTLHYMSLDLTLVLNTLEKIKTLNIPIAKDYLEGVLEAFEA